ncbi:MAG: HAD-like domain-containing protein [Monoraphidium minutum]|nr:MAG: HAD-like domain-containing protein [Monoraphidium minutum]
MDGTLTVPVIDFALMRRKVGVTQGDILDVINSWPEAEQARAHAAIKEIEAQALQDMKLMPGLHELCELLDSAGVPRGLITRNVRSSIEYFHDNHFTSARRFAPAISRECAFPYKPSPVALLHICEEWGVAPGEVIMVGDSAKDDIVCGNRAGALTVLLDTERLHAPGGPVGPPSGEAAPTHTVASMGELSQLLRDRYRLLPPAGEAEGAGAAAAAVGAEGGP